tara:strand:+ start:634 stop:2313 length:1680 start_codon:yes stop_codon:yes gene_type:complete
MAQDSIAYGESLLADIRQRNDKLASRARKQAKKDEWKQFAVDIGADVVNDIFQTKRNALLLNEDTVKQKMAITTANDAAQSVFTEMNNANSSELGKSGYYETAYKKSVDAEMSKKYIKGQRNELQYQQLVNGFVKDNFTAHYAEVLDREQNTTDYISTGSVKNYNANMNKITGDGTAKNALTRVISGLTGNLDVDAYNNKNTTLEKESKAYQSTYITTWNETQNSLLSEAVAELAPDAAGLPAPKLGTGYDVETTDILGTTTKTRVFPAVISQRNLKGEIVQRTVGLTLGTNGYEPLTTPKQNKSYDLAQIGGGLKPQEIARGKIVYQNMPSAQVTSLNAVWQQQIKDERSMIPKDIGYSDFLQAKEESFIRTLVASGKQAVAQGWGTQLTGQKVYIQTVKNRLAEAGGVTTLGQSNIFDTMFAMQELTATNQLINGKSGMRELANRPTDMYGDLEGMSKGQRATLFKRLKDTVDGGVNYFEGNINSQDFQADMLSFENIFNNQTKYNLDNFKSVDSMLLASLQELSNKTPEETTAEDVEERRRARLEKIKNMSIVPTL